jgi:hypothetical protein
VDRGASPRDGAGAGCEHNAYEPVIQAKAETPLSDLPLTIQLFNGHNLPNQYMLFRMIRFRLFLGKIKLCVTSSTQFSTIWNSDLVKYHG